jgi:hypothetical protein
MGEMRRIGITFEEEAEKKKSKNNKMEGERMIEKRMMR